MSMSGLSVQVSAARLKTGPFLPTGLIPKIIWDPRDFTEVITSGPRNSWTRPSSCLWGLLVYRTGTNQFRPMFHMSQFNQEKKHLFTKLTNVCLNESTSTEAQTSYVLELLCVQHVRNMFQTTCITTYTFRTCLEHVCFLTFLPALSLRPSSLSCSDWNFVSKPLRQLWDLHLQRFHLNITWALLWFSRWGQATVDCIWSYVYICGGGTYRINCVLSLWQDEEEEKGEEVNYSHPGELFDWSTSSDSLT